MFLVYMLMIFMKELAQRRMNDVPGTFYGKYYPHEHSEPERIQPQRDTIVIPLPDPATKTSDPTKTSILSMTAIIVIGIMMLLLGELFCVVLALFVNDLDNAQSEADEQLTDETIDEMFEYDEDI